LTLTITSKRRLWRQRSYYALRQSLVDQMGGACVECGPTEDQEINHKFGRTWEPRMICYRDRMKRYEREFRAGELDLRCKSCNRKYWPVKKPGEDLCLF